MLFEKKANYRGGICIEITFCHSSSNSFYESYKNMKWHLHRESNPTYQHVDENNRFELLSSIDALLMLILEKLMS